MRLNLSTSWIFRGWITCFLVTFYAQDVALQCNDRQYKRSNRCCEKCGPGLRVFRPCNGSQHTKCTPCDSGEYQSGWTEDTRCQTQKICDAGKGFMERVDNRLAEEPCRCQLHLQCSPINCEFCERIPTCSAGYGLDTEPGKSNNGRKICIPCKKGFFSDRGEQCKQWTNCKDEGRSETRPGSAQADAECGPHVSVATPSSVIVSVLSVITVLCLLILLLFCFKDKLRLLSVNLRSCVQNLKRTRIQQETQSGGPRCETSKLIYQASHGSSDEPPGPAPVPDVRVSLPVAEERETPPEDRGKGSGEPEEVSEEEEDVVSASPLLEGSCVCVVPICEPLEVGENEDCSQAVSACSCGGLEAERDAGSGKQEKRDDAKARGGGEKGAESLEKVVLPKSASLSPPLLCASSGGPPASPLAEHCLPLRQARTTLEFKPHSAGQPPLKQGQLNQLVSTDSSSSSSSTECSTASAVAVVSPLETSSSVGDLYLDKPEKAQGLFWDGGGGSKLSSGESQLGCSPESLHSQLAEPTVTSGQVLGNHNTTFISSGQVMNFSGDVVVVYVSQTSLGGDGAGQGDTFGSPVQEEASETAPFLHSGPRSRGDSISHSTLQDETLPVQEVMEERPVRQ